MARFTFRDGTRATSLRLRRLIAASRRALAAERLARAFWPFTSTLMVSVALVLLGLFERLPAPWHTAGLAAMGLGLAAALVHGIWRFRAPGEAEARARLDADAPERPLATLADRLAAGAGDDRARAVWLEHQRRAEAAAERLAAAPPDLRLARYDRWAVRLAAPVMLMAGIMAADGRWADRLASLSAPPAAKAQSEGAAAARGPMAEAWATPPAYTGLKTVYLATDGAPRGDFVLPAGTEITLRVTDLDEPPVLGGDAGMTTAGFVSPGAGLSELSGVLERSGRIEIEGGGETLASWNIVVTPDTPPEIEMPQTPVAALTGALEVFFTARDDYGVVSAWGEIVPPGGMSENRGVSLEPLTFALPLPITGDPREVSDSTMHDFGEHPWAGGPVELTLHAEDGAGQVGTYGPVRIMLPGRNFRHPLARALVEQRRELALDFGQAGRVLDVLQAVTRRPDEVFEEKYAAFLGTNAAIRRLALAMVDETLAAEAPAVMEYLWLAALDLEGGDLANALERLRQAQERLRDALENGTDEQVAAAIEELREAIQQYLEEMVRQALENGLDPSQQQQQGQQGNEMTQQDLDEMLDELQRRAEGGLRDQARDMLSQLQRMLENLQAGRMQPGQQGSQGQQALQQLQELIERQRDLADRTFGEARRERREGSGQNQQGGQQPRQGESGREGEGQFGDGRGSGEQGQGREPGGGQRDGGRGQQGLAGEQEALRQLLDELSRGVPGGTGGDELRRALEDAGRAMGDARDDLQDGEPGAAVDDQMEALDRLNEGASALAEALRQQGQGDVNTTGRRGRGEAADNREADPFDRPAGSYGAIDGRDTGVPDRSAIDRARELLEELRRRAGEPMRPQIELDYLDRLIDRF
ncbi:TIGR02302 family protein [Limibaculum sp. M0105]|uniref:TIGR02302 family protein n=1 Tax=Thermohalobaculum xanthum TaxID=2753746 RepID=A0A8J7M6C8_9RHOB|nr:TIGR02302 family protein [Thermohalobaculum xanthum]MBK0399386.1 TIGR02302 family protein [Thermohalobaculum xanthum]